MSQAQARDLKALCERTGECFNPEATRDEANEMIAQLQKQTGAGGEIAGGSPGQSPNPQQPAD